MRTCTQTRSKAMAGKSATPMQRASPPPAGAGSGAARCTCCMDSLGANMAASSEAARQQLPAASVWRLRGPRGGGKLGGEVCPAFGPRAAASLPPLAARRRPPQPHTRQPQLHTRTRTQPTEAAARRRSEVKASIPGTPAAARRGLRPARRRREPTASTGR